MQSIFRRAPIVYFIFVLSVGAIAIVFRRLDYSFIVSNGLIWFFLNIGVLALLTWFCVSKQKDATIASKIVAQLLPMGAAIYIWAIDVLGGNENRAFSVILWLLCFASCYALSLLYKSARVFRAICITLNTILLLCLLPMSLLAMTFGRIGESITVSQTSSPNKTYTAYLGKYDQGALGGSTYVSVDCHTSEIDIGLCRFIKQRNVYHGRWGEFDSIILEWRDDHTLLVNGNPHDIDRLFSVTDVEERR